MKVLVQWLMTLVIISVMLTLASTLIPAVMGLVSSLFVVGIFGAIIFSIVVILKDKIFPPSVNDSQVRALEAERLLFENLPPKEKSIGMLREIRMKTEGYQKTLTT